MMYRRSHDLACSTSFRTPPERWKFAYAQIPPGIGCEEDEGESDVDVVGRMDVDHHRYDGVANAADQQDAGAVEERTDELNIDVARYFFLFSLDLCDGH